MAKKKVSTKKEAEGGETAPEGLIPASAEVSAPAKASDAVYKEDEKPETKKVADFGWKDRLKNERDELKEKIDKLNKALIERLVPDSEREILIRQSSVMGNYLNILNERLKSKKYGE